MTAQTPDLDSVISRVRKLMALTTDRGATEAEASLAAEHVQRMLAEHNLSMSAVEASGASSGDDGKRVKEGVQRRQVYKWQRDLMASIAELNYCKAFTRWQNRGRGKANVFDGYDLIGRASNVATTGVMFDYLLQTIERLAREEVLDPSQYFTRYAHSFKEGCADRLVERLGLKREEIVAESARKAKEQATRDQHPAAARSNLPAVVLSDVIQNETDLNNDFEHGYLPGTTAALRAKYEAERAANKIARDAREAELLAKGYPDDVAYYMMMGYSEERAYDMAKPKQEKPETDAQRRKREKREDRSNRRYWERRSHQDDRLDLTAYRKGKQAGDSVGLDQQVGRGSSKQIGGK